MKGTPHKRRAVPRHQLPTLSPVEQVQADRARTALSHPALRGSLTAPLPTLGPALKTIHTNQHPLGSVAYGMLGGYVDRWRDGRS